ncbi:zinc-binding dehydrogenase [Thermostaphylospora chromogena]|nr:zinc-binding dehydrogenase [Thermostaphylospora chromogena]
MRAIRVDRFGDPRVLVPVELPDPVAGSGQAVVEVAAVDTLFVETQIRSGAFAEPFGVRPPYVPGGAVTGRVRTVGPGVTGDRQGRTVAAVGISGGYAEQVAVPAEALIPVPDGVDPQRAAALLHDGPTALGLFDAAAVQPGRWVLVMAAAGGAGILLVQLARAAGARVIAAARGQRKLDLALEHGAEAAVDYSEPGWSEHVAKTVGGEGVDVVFDGAGGTLGAEAFEVTASGGRFAAYGAPSGDFAAIDTGRAARRGIKVIGIDRVQYGPDERRAQTRRALQEAAAGRIRPVIGRTYPLERAADAHAAIEAREVVGKTLLLP